MRTKHARFGKEGNQSRLDRAVVPHLETRRNDVRRWPLHGMSLYLASILSAVSVSGVIVPVTFSE